MRVSPMTELKRASIALNSSLTFQAQSSMRMRRTSPAPGGPRPNADT